MHPNLKEEKKLWKQGFDVVVGLDEAGRGPLAGPVVAAAVFLQKNSRINLNIKDSKKISEKKRQEFYNILTNHPGINWGVGIVSEKTIDKVNILQATKLAMKKTLENLQKKLENSDTLNLEAFKFRVSLKSIDFILIDGNFKLASKVPQMSIVGGDNKVFSICAAGIIAKVTRDRIMQTMHKKYPNYGFHLHKGYGTALHVANLQKFGPSKIHRKTFYPVSSLLN